VIAGAILQFASWRWLFFVNLPIGGSLNQAAPIGCQKVRSPFLVMA
jgi:MFS family permease